MNNPVFFEAAQGLATGVLREAASSTEASIDSTFRIALSRMPSRKERERLLAYYRRQIDRQTSAPAYPVARVSGIAPAAANAWIGLSSVILNLDEFLTRD